MNWYNYFNYGTIIFVAVLLVLVLLNAVPDSLYIPILILTIIIFIARIIARFFLIKKSKSLGKE